LRFEGETEEELNLIIFTLYIGINSTS